MSLKNKLRLLPGEEIIQIVNQTGKYSWWRYFFAFAILTTNTFFTFWFWMKGPEARIVYGLIWVIGLYILISTRLIDRANNLVVTTDRIFDIHRASLFNETVSSLHFLEIGDVTVERRGIVSSILNFGLISIYPKEGNFSIEFSGVKRPEYVQNIILERKSAHHGQKVLKSKEEVLKQFLRIVPELSEAELTAAYQKINQSLLNLADPKSGNKNQKVI